MGQFFPGFPCVVCPDLSVLFVFVSNCKAATVDRSVQENTF